MQIRQFYNKNQFLFYDERKLVFQSYDSVIAEIDKKTGELFFGSDWNYSNTTRKHLYMFLNDYNTKSARTYTRLFFAAVFNIPKTSGSFYKILLTRKL